MIQKTDTWELLSSLKPFMLQKSDLTKASQIKVKDTIKYSLRQNEHQDHREVAQRCLIAILAEQQIAAKVHGYLPSGRENFDNPFSWAYDVVAKDGVRIEVKTHQSSSKWINLVIDSHQRASGINIAPFLKHKLADLIIILDTKQNAAGHYLFTPKMMAAPSAFHPNSGLIKESNYNDGYYLGTCDPEKYDYLEFTPQI